MNMSKSRMRMQEQQPGPPTPPPGPQPPGPEPNPESTALAPAPGAVDMMLPYGMPGQREGRPTTASEAALQLTLKWMDHAADAAELALGDQELSEAQAQSVGAFFSSVLQALHPYFPATNNNPSTYNSRTDRRG